MLAARVVGREAGVVCVYGGSGGTIGTRDGGECCVSVRAGIAVYVRANRLT